MKSPTQEIDIRKTPFSRYGSYLALVDTGDGRTVSIHNARRRFGEDLLYHLTFWTEGEPVTIRVAASPWAVTVESGSGRARLYLKGDTALMIETEGLDAVFVFQQAKGHGVQEALHKFKVISPSSHCYIAFDVMKGHGVLVGPMVDRDHSGSVPSRRDFRLECEDGAALAKMDVAIVEQSPARTLMRTVPKADLSELRKEWEDFSRRMPPVAESRRAIALTTWYNLWSSTVRAGDVYNYDAMLMSKRTLGSVWAWDHCFCALAMAGVNPRLALDQFLLPFEMQSRNGCLPDMLNPNAEVAWGLTKPPIHGWCFGLLMDECTFDTPTFNKVYGHLEKWTQWWMTYRDADRNGIPEYPQGADSGWDNATPFDVGFFVETPDLPAYLILQMRTLARIADRLKSKGDAAKWRADASALLARMVRSMWNGKHFVSRALGSSEVIDTPTSLLALMPIALGDLLDKEIFDSLVARLETEFLTPHGPASEALRSPKYISDSFWRGPIWASSTYLIVDGLLRGGREALALRIARNFCDMVQNTAGGNHENFDALTGKGLRAPGHTLTASVNMIFLQMLHRRGVE